jgi:hypothetical protein
MKNFFLALLVLVFFCASCSPVYKNFYDYETPKSTKSHECIQRCSEVRQDCEYFAQQKYDNCENRAQQEYLVCESGKIYRTKRNGDVECVVNCYCSKSSCPEPDQEACEERYGTCFASCGGKVTVTTRCVENCDKADPPKSRIVGK